MINETWQILSLITSKYIQTFMLIANSLSEIPPIRYYCYFLELSSWIINTFSVECVYLILNLSDTQVILSTSKDGKKRNVTISNLTTCLKKVKEIQKGYYLQIIIVHYKVYDLLNMCRAWYKTLWITLYSFVKKNGCFDNTIHFINFNARLLSYKMLLGMFLFSVSLSIYVHLSQVLIIIQLTEGKNLTFSQNGAKVVVRV